MIALIVFTEVGTPMMWAGFFTLIALLLWLDLGVLHKKQAVLGPKDAIKGTLAWMSMALLFCLFLGWRNGKETALQFFQGYLVEEMLSVDNLFVILVIFKAFKVPEEFRHRVLYWGILGAVVMRLIFILAGVALIHKFAWLEWVLGAFLIYTGVKLLVHKDKEEEGPDPMQSPVLRLFRRVVPSVNEFRGSHFWVREDGKLKATPLLAVLVMVETTDLIFAVDSIPAIFGLVEDPFVIFSSNIFAVLGLRALFFLLAGLMGRFHYLKHALALILPFIGMKMLLKHHISITPNVSLLVIISTLAGAVLASFLREKKIKRKNPAGI
ncbi:MAG: TerC family protein [Planctomycetota bacterium]